MRVIGFLGSGSMAQAMARGWSNAGLGSGRMLFADSGSGRAAELAAELGGEVVESNRDLARRSDLLVLGCKPKDLEAAGRQAASGGLILSLLGATPIEAVRAAFPGSEVHRAMPNLAVEVNLGTICLAEAGDEHRGEIRELLSLLGEVIDLPEREIDAATAVMACSPAYLDLFVDALAEAGARAGLDPRLSARMATLTLAGTARLLAGRSPGEIRHAVASPGGSTEAGLASLRRDEFEAAVARAVDASLERMRGSE